MIFCWIPNNRPWGNFLLNYAMDYLKFVSFSSSRLAQGTSVQGRDRGPSHKQSLDSSTFEIQKSYCPPPRELC